MNIIYISNARIPTEWAHGLQIMKTCEALALSGARLELWIPDKKMDIHEDPFAYYGVKKAFPIKRFFTFDLIWLGKIGFIIQSVSFALAVLPSLRRTKRDTIYCRDEIIVALLLFFGVRDIVWESHDGSWGVFARYAAQNARRMVVVTQGLKDFYCERGMVAGDIYVIPNGIDLKSFEHPESGEKARARLGLPLGKKIALYIGMLEGWKGTGTLLKASSFVSSDTVIVIIGGESEQQVARLADEYPRVRFLGFRPVRELADNQAAADVLILPNTGVGDISVRFTSPLKLLSYMASGRPVIASDLPSIREVVGEKDAFLVPPDNPDALAKMIDTVLENPHDAQMRAQAARERVQEYTWEKRAQRILDALEEKTV
ncbi:MAG: glycosyltransferase family 4 protein [Patescibacteria group bacterium]